MLLGFREQYNGLDTGFVPKLLAGMPNNVNLKAGRDFADFQTDYWHGVNTYSATPKIHTIREDVNERWKADELIHFAVQVRRPGCRIFMLGFCTGVQDIVFRIGSASGRLLVAIGNKQKKHWSVLDDAEALMLARNDGFETWAAFDAWFRPITVKQGNRYDAKLIHWTKYRY